MSTFNDLNIECPVCGEEFMGTVWTAVHAKEDPKLKEKLLGGELNILFCPKCSHTFYYEHFLLYQDPALRLVAYVYPPSEETHRKDLELMMKKGFSEAQATFDPKDRLPYEPTIFFGLDELQVRIREGDEQLIKEEVEKARQRSRKA
jgi:hypothetical protein